MKRRKFSGEFKAKTALAVLSNKETAAEAAKRIDCHPKLIHKWRDEFESRAHLIFEGGSKEQKVQQKKIDRYEKVITKLTTQKDFLERVLTSLE